MEFSLDPDALISGIGTMWIGCSVVDVGWRSSWGIRSTRTARIMGAANGLEVGLF
jgi:hypothetical protein